MLVAINERKAEAGRSDPEEMLLALSGETLKSQMQRKMDPKREASRRALAEAIEALPKPSLRGVAIATTKQGGGSSGSRDASPSSPTTFGRSPPSSPMARTASPPGPLDAALGEQQPAAAAIEDSDEPAGAAAESGGGDTIAGVGGVEDDNTAAALANEEAGGALAVVPVEAGGAVPNRGDTPGSSVLFGERSHFETNRWSHFHPFRHGRNIRVSPDGTTATCRHAPYGGMVISQKPLPRNPRGWYFEIKVEEVDVSRLPDGSRRWKDGCGIGVTKHLPETLFEGPKVGSLQDAAKDQNSDGFACEMLSEAWLLGYDGRAQLAGRSRHLVGREMPKGYWCPGQAEPGDTLSLFATPDGHLLLFCNRELKACCFFCAVLWRPPLYGVVDLDGNTLTVQFVEKGPVPDKVNLAVYNAIKAAGITDG